MMTVVTVKRKGVVVQLGAGDSVTVGQVLSVFHNGAPLGQGTVRKMMGPDTFKLNPNTVFNPLPVEGDLVQ